MLDRFHLKKFRTNWVSAKAILERFFHHELGISVWDYLTRYRIKETKFLLETTELTITAVATQVGFDDSAYFSRVFRSLSGQSPKEYRNLLFKAIAGLAMD